MKVDDFLSFLLIGPFMLLLGLSALLLKVVFTLWPLVIVAFMGFLFIWIAKTRGLVLSLVSLALIMVWQHIGEARVGSSLLLACSVGLSWWIFYLGYQRAQLFCTEKEKDIEVLQQQAQELTALVKKKKQELQESSDRQLIEITSYQRKEKALERALEGVQSQLLVLQQSFTSPAVEKISASCEEHVQKNAKLEQLERQLVLLKEQFQEKSQVLHETRKQLFLTENQLFILQKECEEQGCAHSVEDDAFLAHIKHLEEELSHVESQSLVLEQLISQLLSLHKAPFSRQPKRMVSQFDLPFLEI